VVRCGHAVFQEALHFLKKSYRERLLCLLLHSKRIVIFMSFNSIVGLHFAMPIINDY